MQSCFIGVYSISVPDKLLINKILSEAALSNRRSGFQVTIELLKAIAFGEHRPTRLMYRCNLSWGSLIEKLSLLELKGYINDVSGDEKHRQYCITSTGNELLTYLINSAMGL